ncbi:MAG: LysR family transcriptional regulator [Burkholderiales bacterium]|nr:LysR family transcriptional regulator [Burkholderiales bacterium]
MTLTEFKYIVALARERHFGRAAKACFVSQPTLSVAVRKLEDELGVTLFERGMSEVSVTPMGEQIVVQAKRVLEETTAIRQMAHKGKEQLNGALRVGAIYTIAPYLFPKLIPVLHEKAPLMPLLIQENFTNRLADLLKRGELDVVIFSAPFSEPGIMTQEVYEEPFRVALPAGHKWASKASISAAMLAQDNLFLLAAGNCFRDQVLQASPALSRTIASSSGLQKTVEGSSLETIRYMVASGAGITVLPSTAADAEESKNALIEVRPFSSPVPSRHVILAWRKSFYRPQAVEAVRQAILDCPLPGVTKLGESVPSVG